VRFRQIVALLQVPHYRRITKVISPDFVWFIWRSSVD
jgi:Fe-S cluster assembly ATPase SufC